MENYIPDQIMNLASKNGMVTTEDVAKALGVTRQYALRLLKQLVKRGLILRVGKTRGAHYILSDSDKSVEEVVREFERHYTPAGLEEDLIVDQAKQAMGLQIILQDNVQRVLAYGLSEMANNAIEHSQGDSLDVRVWLTNERLCFTVEDNGIGVFRSVMKERKLLNPFEAMQDLLKGKTTSYPERHSGEGIFFTSKVADRFSLSSYGYEMIVDNLIDDVFFKQTEDVVIGTRVNFCINRDSDRQVMDVFNRFSSDDEMQFDTTEIRVKLYEPGLDYISRSQGRRMMASLDRFKQIVLDFEGVDSIGQGFADEVFRVFLTAHPNTKIKPTNMNEAVAFMVNRVAKK